MNFFLALTAGYQLARVTNYRLKEGDSASQVIDYILNGKKDTPAQAVEAAKDTVTSA